VSIRGIEARLRQGVCCLLASLTMITASAQSPEERSQGGLREFSLTTEYQAGPCLVQVLLPDRLEPSRRYPVLYILPVESGTKTEYGSGIEEARKADIANKYGVICVGPTFNKAAPWYGNHATNPELRQEDYFVEALVPYIDAHFPTRADKEGRLLIGFSKSAWGAFTLLMRHPEKFGYAAGWDSPLMIDGKNDDWGPMGLSANFGTKEAMQKNLPTRLASDNAAWLKLQPRLVLGPGIYWAKQTEAMHDHLQALGIPHVYRADLLFSHRWDTGWFAPVADELIRLSKGPQAKP
jgi:S-formylglutathione hydrolase FrmB